MLTWRIREARQALFQLSHMQRTPHGKDFLCKGIWPSRLLLHHCFHRVVVIVIISAKPITKFIKLSISTSIHTAVRTISFFTGPRRQKPAATPRVTQFHLLLCSIIGTGMTSPIVISVQPLQRRSIIWRGRNGHRRGHKRGRTRGVWLRYEGAGHTACGVEHDECGGRYGGARAKAGISMGANVLCPETQGRVLNGAREKSALRPRRPSKAVVVLVVHVPQGGHWGNQKIHETLLARRTTARYSSEPSRA